MSETCFYFLNHSIHQKCKVCLLLYTKKFNFMKIKYFSKKIIEFIRYVKYVFFSIPKNLTL